MKRILLLAIFLAATLAASAQRPLKLTYTFTPDVTSPATLLHVLLTFQGNANGTSRLTLPTAFAGQRDLFSSVRDIKTISPETVLTPTTETEIRDLRYPPNHLVEISYSLYTEAKPVTSTNAANQKDAAAQLIFNGQNGLIHPELTQTIRVQVTFHWKNLPSDWVVATSFGTERNSTRAAEPPDDGTERGPDLNPAKAPEHLDQAFTGEWSKVFDAVFAAGNFRLTRLEGSGETLTLVTSGKWNFKDSDAAEEVLSVFRAERRFWGESKPDQFLVILTPDDQASGTSDGTVFTGAFLLHLARSQTFGIEERSLLAHEIFHIWNPYRMGLPAGEATEWFTEGFTHYYQDRILLESGVLTYPGYLKRLNQIVAAYWSSPDRNWSQTRWLQRTTTGDAEYALPYKRGAMIALWLDEHIRKSSAGRSSLDNKMYELVDGQEKLLTAGYLITSFSNGLSRQDADQFRSFLATGASIPLPIELAPACATLVKPPGVAAPYYKPSLKTGCENQLSARGTRPTEPIGR